MAGYSGSFRAQMEQASERKTFAADFSAAMDTAADNASWTRDFLDNINKSTKSMLDEYDSFLQKDFTPPPDAKAMSGGAGGRGGLGNLLPEAAADGALFQLSKGLAFGVGFEAGWMFADWIFGPDTPVAYTYTFPADWVVTCNLTPNPLEPSRKLGVVPTPPGWPGAVNGNCNVSTVNSANNAQGVDIPAGSTRVQLISSSNGSPWPNRNGRPYFIATHSASPSADKVPAVQNGKRNRLGPMDVPWSRPDPFPTDDPGGDPDHPSRSWPRRWSWRDAPPDPWKWAEPGPQPPDQPPPGGSSGGGGSSGSWGSSPNPQAPGLPWQSDAPPSYRVPAVNFFPDPEDDREPENDWHLLVPDYAIKILIEYGIYKDLS